MSEWHIIIPTIIALGGVKCILIITFLFWGIGLRGMIGALLSAVLGSLFVLSQLDLSPSGTQLTHEQRIEQSIEHRISPRIVDLFQDIQPQLEEKLGKDDTRMFFAVVSDATAGLAAVIIVIPFLLIDIAMLFLFRLLDIEGYRVEYVTLPLKVLLFLSVDGVSLIARMMVLSA